MWARHGAPRSQPTLSTAVHPGSDGWRAKISPARPSGLRHSPLVQLIFASALHMEFCLARARPSDAGRVRSSPRRARPRHRRTASRRDPAARSLLSSSPTRGQTREATSAWPQEPRGTTASTSSAALCCRYFRYDGRSTWAVRRPYPGTVNPGTTPGNPPKAVAAR